MKSCAWKVLIIDLFCSGLGSLAAEKFDSGDTKSREEYAGI
jgi:hypothetical protein